MKYAARQGIFAGSLLSLLRVVVLLSLATGGLHATSEATCTVPCRQFRDLVDASRRDSAKEVQTLAFLRLIAEGRSEEVTAGMAHFAGVHHPSVLRGAYKGTEIRIGAYRHIGYMGTAAAVEYLQQVTPSAFKVESFERQDLWPEVQIALRDARRRMLPQAADAVRYLEAVLEEEGDWFSAGHVRSWAVNELCSRGALGSLPAVTKALRRIGSSRLEERAQFCQEKMVVAASHPDRVRAISSALTIQNAQSNPELVRWAISEIRSTRDPARLTILNAYFDQLEAIPENTALGIEVRNRVLYHNRPRPLPRRPN
ncbi:MAG: hypothetical protein KIT83_14095 [Bryobacterales bacterium]|nr:hypothetical protein [Bryobacterales bacterium]